MYAKLDIQQPFVKVLFQAEIFIQLIASAAITNPATRRRKDNMYKIERTDNEIDDLLNACAETKDTQGTKFSGARYEDGIEAAIRWLTDKDADYIYE